MSAGVGGGGNVGVSIVGKHISMKGQIQDFSSWLSFFRILPVGRNKGKRMCDLVHFTLDQKAIN